MHSCFPALIRVILVLHVNLCTDVVVVFNGWIVKQRNCLRWSSIFLNVLETGSGHCNIFKILQPCLYYTALLKNIIYWVPSLRTRSSMTSLEASHIKARNRHRRVAKLMEKSFWVVTRPLIVLKTPSSR